MRDFFTRRYDEKYKNSIYYFENKKQIICKAKRTFPTFTHKLSLEVNGVEQYKIIRTKGSIIAEILMTFVKNFKNIEFTIFTNSMDNVGRVCFKNKRSFEIYLNNSTYVLINHKGGYFSIKKDSKQIALLRREPIAKCFYNRYFVWYDIELNGYIDILLLILSLNDYMYYCNDWSYNTQKDILPDISWKISDNASIYPYFKRVDDIEVNWRPSDSNYKCFNDNLYFQKIELLQKKVNKFSILFIIMFILIILIIISVKFTVGY
ncbi:MAG: hypothetical protein V8S74_11130 [Lachnospirales bacterium]